MGENWNDATKHVKIVKNKEWLALKNATPQIRKMCTYKWPLDLALNMDTDNFGKSRWKELGRQITLR